MLKRRLTSTDRSYPYEYAVDRAKANLADVRTELETLKAEYQSKLANIDVAQSQLDYARIEEKRQYNLRQKIILLKQIMIQRDRKPYYLNYK